MLYCSPGRVPTWHSPTVRRSPRRGSRALRGPCFGEYGTQVFPQWVGAAFVVAWQVQLGWRLGSTALVLRWYCCQGWWWSSLF
jgi:hypothetical protein